MEGIPEILRQFGLDPSAFTTKAFGSGLIHHTYLVRNQDGPAYILQQVNHQVFRHPEDIAHNIRCIGNYLLQHHPGYPFTIPVLTTAEQDYVIHLGNYYRLFPFVQGSHTIDVCHYPDQAYQAASQFGQFTAVLKGFRTDMLRFTIPGFHDLSGRYQQFLHALKEGNPDRLRDTQKTAELLLSHQPIVERFEAIRTSPEFKLRVTHHDTKISNVLLNDEGKGICVIDLDTTMPGLFISDVGDMIRTYVSPANEEEQDLDQIVVRKEFLDAIISGYSQSMYDQLSSGEKDAFSYAGHFMVYMQALRFYTDHLMNDQYYGARYEGHNLLRARNQLTLLQRLMSRD